MKKLIYVTGDMNSFFVNEIQTLVERFDNVHVLVYKGDQKKYDEIAKKYGFTYEEVSFKKNIVKNILTFIPWVFSHDVILEIKRKCKSENAIKKFCYIMFYGIYAASVKNQIESVMGSDEIYLYSFWLSRPAYAISLFNLNRSKKIRKIVSRTHRYDLYEEENVVSYLPFRKFINENLDVIYFISKDGLEYYTKKNYSDKKEKARYEISYLGTLDKDKISRIDDDKDEIVFASCSYIMQRKRLDLIIKFLSSPAFKNMNIRWLHIGNGKSQGQIEELAEKKLNIKYEFLGKIDNEQLFEVYRKEKVNFFINMSDSEGVPVSAMEAMSVGIPVIARNVGGNADLVKNGISGYLLDSNRIKRADFNKIAKQVIRSVSNREDYNNLCNGAYDVWKKGFNAHDNMMKFCDELLSDNK